MVEIIHSKFQNSSNSWGDEKKIQNREVILGAQHHSFNSPDTTGYIIHRLQLEQNAAAKTVADLKKFGHVTHVLQNLNWLPVEKRIMFKLLLLCYKALNGAGPVYLKDMTQLAEPKRSGLRSADDFLHLERPHTRPITVGDRAFSFAAIDLWNKLPLKLRDSKTLDTFKSDLKTYLFKYKSK